MKKSYLMIAAAAALFAACAEKDTFKDVDNQESPIIFEQALNKTTRAYIADKAALATPGFKVFGYKTNKRENNQWVWTGSGVVQTIFDGNQKVYSENSGTSWKYDQLRFWDKTASYNFYAIAPYAPSTGVTYGLKTNSNEYTEHYFQINNAASALYTLSDDYIIDRDGVKGVMYSTNNGTASFDFHHVMARVDVKLKSTLSSGTIEVTELKMSGWNNSTGTFIQNATTTPTSLNKDEWTLAASNTSGDVTLIPSTVKPNARTAADPGQQTVQLTCKSENPTIVNLEDWYIMVPQEIASGVLTFTVSYTYDDGHGYTENFVDQVATIGGSNSQIWGTDSHTTYTLDIKPNDIKFDVTSICGFHVLDGSDQQGTTID